MPNTITGGALALQSGGARLLEGGAVRLLEGGHAVLTSDSQIHRLFNTTVTILRLAPTKDASYGPIAGYSILLQDLPANVADLSGRQIMALAQLGFSATKDVLIDDPGVEIRNGDAVQEASGKFYRVTNVNRRASLRSDEVSIGLDCEEYAP